MSGTNWDELAAILPQECQVTMERAQRWGYRLLGTGWGAFTASTTKAGVSVQALVVWVDASVFSLLCGAQGDVLQCCAYGCERWW